MMKMTAMLAGATGLVGAYCLRLLLQESQYEKITVIGRRHCGVQDARLDEIIVDFGELAGLIGRVRTDDVYCCLGTTIKVAGSRDAFRRVDLVYPLELADLALAGGARQFLLVSSMGANSASKVFYNRTKGEVEQQVSALEFESVQIFRPSLLMGERSEHRPGEKIAQKLTSSAPFLFKGPLNKYRPVNAEVVARAMIKIGLECPLGVNIYESTRIQQLGQVD